MIVVAAAACAGAPPSPPTRMEESPRPLATERSLPTPGGAVYTAPRGWFVTPRDGAFVLEDPERALSLVLREIQNAPPTVAAIEGAWRRHHPGLALSVRRKIEVPAKDGWDEIVQVHYHRPEVAPPRMATALAVRKGNTVYLTLLEGTRAAVDRRQAQWLGVVLGLKAPGVTVESFAGRRPHPLDGGRLATLQAFITEAMAAADVPGAAIAVVQGGRVVLEKGFGTRQLAHDRPVTPATLFMIGSTTKPLTTLMMARLADEGRLGWETPITSLLPNFALADAAMTARLTLQDTVCACTGLPRQDMEILFEHARMTPEALIEAMRAMKPTTGFGETFQYSNAMVSAGGYAAAAALGGRGAGGGWLGAAYDRAMQTRVFDPLGMAATTFDLAAVRRQEHAVPHARDLALRPVPIALAHEEVRAWDPAGGAWSNVRDLARYLLAELAGGSSPNLLRRRAPRVKAGGANSYGLGLFVERDRGVVVVHHGGNKRGFTSDMFFLPEHGVGVVLLANAGGANPFRNAVRRRVLELLFDGRDEARRSLAAILAQQRQGAQMRLAEVTFTPDGGWLGKLAGRYEHPQLGQVTVRVDEAAGTGTLDAGEWEAAIGQRRRPDGTPDVILTGPPEAGLQLRPGGADGAGRVTTLTLDTPQQRYVFRRR